jgi:quercetin dioxygenase-like cupin family protein
MGNLVKKELFEGVSTRVAWGEKMMMSFVDLMPHSTVPLHSHPHEQIGFVLKGQFELTIAEECRLLQEGDAYLIPSGVEHSVKTQARKSRTLEIFSPPREEYK